MRPWRAITGRWRRRSELRSELTEVRRQADEAETARVVAVASSGPTTLDYRATALSRLRALYDESALTICRAARSHMGQWHIRRRAATLTIQSFLPRQMFLRRHRVVVAMQRLVCAYLRRIALASEV